MSHVISEDVMSRASLCVREGGVLLYPTDTVYGLGGDALDAEVSDRIRRLKGTPADKPLLLLTDTWERVASLIRPPDGVLSDLMRAAANVPLTILIPASDSAPRSLVGSSDEIGIRLTHHAFCRRLIEDAETLLSSTSANSTGNPTPVRMEDVEPSIREGVDMVVDGGALKDVPSTIVRVSSGKVEIVREGSVSAAQIDTLLN